MLALHARFSLAVHGARTRQKQQQAALRVVLLQLGKASPSGRSADHLPAVPPRTGPVLRDKGPGQDCLSRKAFPSWLAPLRDEPHEAREEWGSCKNTSVLLDERVSSSKVRERLKQRNPRAS